MDLNPLHWLRPPTPEEAGKSGVKTEAPGWFHYVGQSIGGIGYSMKHAARAVLTSPTNLIKGSLALGRNTIETPIRLVTNPVFRLIDGYHKRIDKLLSFGGT